MTTDTTLHTPHDVLFKSMTSNLAVTIDLLKSKLPAELFAKIKLDTLTLTNKSFVSEQLKSHHSDMIYKAEINGHRGYIAFILEHQSTSEELMAFRKLEYNVALMRQHLLQGADKLPTIINI